MIRVLPSLVLILGTTQIAAINLMPTPAAGEKIAEVKDPSAVAVEQKASDKPLRIEQECPTPEMTDVIKSSSWNTVEVGVSFPLGEGLGGVVPYSRYTCQTSHAVPRSE